MSVDLNADNVAVGSLLFHDPRLSHDDGVSCATCHSLSMGGVDRLPLSIGIGGQHVGRTAQRLGIMEPLATNLSLGHDAGRFSLTGDGADNHAFKVTSLRN